MMAGKTDAADKALDIERGLLGECFITPENLDVVRECCDDVDFYLVKHRRIYGRMLAMRDAGLVIDPYAVFASFDRDGEASEVGGLPALTDIAGESLLRDVRGAALHIRHLAQRRRARAALSEALEALGNGAPLKQALGGVAGLAEAMEGGAGDAILWGDAMANVSKSRILSDIADDGGGYISTGLRDLDEALGGGGRRGMLTVVAARPSMGKSCFLGQVLLNIARRQSGEGIASAFFSYEMAAETVALRFVQNIAGVSPSEAVTKYAEGIGCYWADIQAAVNDIAALDGYLGVYDAKVQTIEEAWAMVKRAKRDRPVAVVGLDYAQLMASSPQYRGNEVAALGHIAKTAKRMAKEEDVWVILLSQLNRKLEDREDKRPRKADIRASGEVEEAADTIIGLYRPVYYEVEKANANRRPTDKPINEDDRMFDQTREIAEAIILKDRSGTGAGKTVSLRFIKGKQRFVDAGW